MADQGVSSLSNVVVAIFVARSLPDAGFGAFAAATIAYMVTTGTARSLIGEPLLSRYSHAEADVRRRLVPDMLGATLVVSAAAAVVVALLAAVVGGASGSALLAMALVLPLMIVQDCWRYAFIVDRPGAALGVDLVWLLGVALAMPLAPAGADAAWFVWVWGLAAGAGALVGWAAAGVNVGVPHPWRWLADNRAMGSRFFGEFLTGQAVGQFVLACVGALSGLGVLGAVRAAQVFYGPLNTVHAGIYLAVVPEGAQARDRPAVLRRLMLGASGVLAGVALGWMCVGLVLPDRWGAELFGATWTDAQELMLPMGLAMMAGSLATGGFAGVRSLGAARESLRARLQTVAPQLGLPLAGAALAAGPGYAAGFGAGHAVAAVIWWLAFRRALAGRAVDAPGVSSPSMVPAAPV
jgi:O-antigen/teichoic acid export membrane protein